MEVWKVLISSIFELFALEINMFGFSVTYAQIFIFFALLSLFVFLVKLFI